MSYVIVCPCSQQMTVEDDFAGRRVICVKCGSTLTVPPATEDGSPARAESSADGSASQASVAASGSYTAPDSTSTGPGPQSGTTPGAAYPYSPPAGQKPHRGSTILVLGILGIALFFVCGCVSLACALPAWIMGNQDLKEMRDGIMDRAGESQTNAGRVCGIIGVILAVAGSLVGVFVWLALVGSMGAAGVFKGF